MEKLIPSNIEELKPYVAGKTIEEVVREYKPERISKLASNENRLGYSSLVDQAVSEALKVINNYPDPQSLSLKSALSDILAISEEKLIIGAGSESLIAMLCRTFFNEGESIVTADATFIGMNIQAKIHNIPVIQVPLTSGYAFNPEAIVEAVTDHTKLVYIANPNNPTGTYLTQDQFEWIMDAIPKHVLVVMDEAYYEFARHEQDYPDTLSTSYENLIVLRTFSKGYGLAGFRIGYGIASEELIGYMNKTKLTFEPGHLAQQAALVSLTDRHFLEQSYQMVSEGRTGLYNFFDEIGIQYVPSAANFVMAVFSSAEEAETVTHEMLKQGVILRWLKAFGLENCVRITIGTSDEMQHFRNAFLTLN